MKVGDVCDVITDFVAAGSFEDIRKNVEYLRDNGYAQLVRTKDIKNKFSSDDSVFISRASYEYLWRVHLDKPCVVLPNVGNCGEVYYLSPNLLPCEYNALGPNAILVRSIDQDNYFLSLVFETRAFQEQLKLITSPTGQKKFNKTDIKKIGIFLPGVLEQQKIAAFFTVLDEKIELNKKRKENLLLIKKSLLESAFKTPVAFRKLGDCAIVKDSVRVPKVEWRDTGIPYVRAKDLNDGLSNCELFLEKEVFAKYMRQTGSPENGDVLFVTGGNIGLSMYKNNDDPIYLQGGAVLCVKTSRSDVLNGKFLHYYMQTEKCRRFVLSRASGGTIKHFTLKPALEMPIPVFDGDKQQMIADVFECIDKKLSIIGEYICNFEKLKVSLMNRMFL